MQTNIVISLEILRWIISHISTDTLPPKIMEYLNRWTDGEKATFRQIEEVSRATKIPLGYFFLQTPPTEDTVIEGVQGQHFSRDFMDTLHNMTQIQAWMHDCLIAEGNAPVEIVSSLKAETSVKIFAQKVRDLLSIGLEQREQACTMQDAFELVRTSISDTGVIVMTNGMVGNDIRRPLNVSEFRAFSLVDDYAPLIFINSNDSVEKTLFSLLYAFSCICAGENGLLTDCQKSKPICNAVATEICQKVAQRTGHSDQSEQKNLQVKNSMDRRFLQYLVNSVSEGKTLYTNAYRLTDTNRFTFATLANTI